MRAQEYIGVSGVVNREQHLRLNSDFEALGLTWWRNLQLGIKATHKTQFEDTENKYGREWYPVGEEIANLTQVQFDDYTTQVAQVYFDASRVHDRSYRQEFLDRIAERGEGWLTGLQYDMLPWHTDLGIVRQLREDGPAGTELLLQCHGDVMRTHTPQEVANKLARVAGYFDYVLFDASHGTGKRLDSEALLPYLAAAYDAPDLDRVGIGVAGGFNASVVRDELPKLLGEFPDLSWDAEGQLHPVNANGKRPLDMQVTHDYLAASIDALQS